MEKHISISELKIFAHCQAACLLIVTALLCISDAMYGKVNPLQLKCCLVICATVVSTLGWHAINRSAAFRYWVNQSLFYLALSGFTMMIILSLR